jgi:hypothetical protein
MATAAEIKKKVDGMRSHEYEAWRSNPANRAEVAILDGMSISTPGFKRIDLQARPTEQRYAVLQPCFACGKDVAVASDHQGQVFCSDGCATDVTAAEQSARNVLRSFADSEPRFYRCQFNTQRLVDHFQAHPGLTWDVPTVKKIFATLLAENQVLPKITLKELEAMTAEAYDERLRRDPELGGFKDKIEKKEILREGRSNRNVESAQPSFELRPKEAAMQKAAQQQLRNQAAGYENRGKTISYRNGVPVEVPDTEQRRVFRNGRLM